MCVPLNISLHSLSGIIMIVSINTSKLFCNSVAITKENFNDSTLFCHVSGWTMIFVYKISVDSKGCSYISLLGAAFHYFLASIALWWFFHVCSIFYKIMFPLKAKQYQKKEKYFHIIILVAGMFHCM